MRQGVVWCTYSKQAQVSGLPMNTRHGCRSALLFLQVPPSVDLPLADCLALSVYLSICRSMYHCLSICLANDVFVLTKFPPSSPRCLKVRLVACGPSQRPSVLVSSLLLLLLHTTRSATAASTGKAKSLLSFRSFFFSFFPVSLSFLPFAASPALDRNFSASGFDGLTYVPPSLPRKPPEMKPLLFLSALSS